MADLEASELEQLVATHARWVYASARRRVGRADLAEDVAQAVFVLLWRKWPGRTSQSGLTGWLYRAVGYCSANALRVQRIRAVHEREAAMIRPEQTDDVRWGDVEGELESAVDGLRGKDREAILLRFYRGMSHLEVGQAMGISEEAAKMRVGRAIERLRVRLEDRGVVASSAGLSAIVLANVSPEVSGEFVQGMLGAVGGGESAAASAIAKGAIKMMAWSTAKVAALVVAGVVMAGGGIALQQALAQSRVTTTVPSSAAAQAAEPARQIVYFGRVLTPEDKPVAGARVFLVSDDSWSGRQTIDSTKTDADGRFGLKADKEHSEGGSIIVQADGFGLTCGSVSPDASEGDPDDIQLQPQAELHVRFVDVDGKPAAQVRVGLASIRRKRVSMAYVPPELDALLTQTTDAKGECVFRGLPLGGVVALDVRDERFAMGYSDRNIDLGDGPSTEGVVAKLRAAASVTGRVVGEDGKPASGVRIAAQATDRNGSAAWASDISDAQGVYHLKRLLAGEYNIAHETCGELVKHYTARALEAVTLEPGQSLNGQDFRLVRGGVLTGRITVKGTAEPVPDVWIGVYGPAHPKTSAWVQGTKSGADGTFEFRVPSGAQHVYISQQTPLGLSAGQTIHDLTVGDGEKVTVGFELSRISAPPVRGRVVDTSGKPVARAHVWVEPGRNSPFNFNAGAGSVTTDTEGRFDVPSVADGFRVSAMKHHATTEQPIVVGPGTRDLTLVIRVLQPASALVHVRKEDDTPVAGAAVTLFQWSGNFGESVETRKTGTEGAVIFKALSPNLSYQASVTAEGFGTGKVLLKLKAGAQAEAGITLPKADSFIAGVVVDEDRMPVPGIEVTLDSSKTGHRSARTDDEGRFRLEFVVPGDKAFVGTRDNNHESQPQSVQAGTTDAVITVKPAAKPPATPTTQP